MVKSTADTTGGPARNPTEGSARGRQIFCWRRNRQRRQRTHWRQSPRHCLTHEQRSCRETDRHKQAPTQTNSQSHSQMRSQEVSTAQSTLPEAPSDAVTHPARHTARDTGRETLPDTPGESARESADAAASSSNGGGTWRWVSACSSWGWLGLGVGLLCGRALAYQSLHLTSPGKPLTRIFFPPPPPPPPPSQLQPQPQVLWVHLPGTALLFLSRVTFTTLLKLELLLGLAHTEGAWLFTHLQLTPPFSRSKGLRQRP